MLASQQTGSTRFPVFSRNLTREQGKEAWNTNLRLASLAARKVASCLGPSGAYKLVTYYRGPELVTKVTKDAVDVVDELGVQYPAIKTVAEAAKIHRDNIGDGVSTLLVLLSALLEEAEKLIQMGVHPIAILDGYNQATRKALDIIDEIAMDFTEDIDNCLVRNVDCGRGLLGPKITRALTKAVEMARSQSDVDLNRVKIEKKLGGAIEDSDLVNGVIIKREKIHYSMPDRIDNPRIALVAKRIEIKPFEQLAKGEGPFSARLNIEEAKQLSQFKCQESALRINTIEKVKASGANVLLCRSRIEERVADSLARKGIFALKSVDPKDLDEVGRVTGARMVADVNMLEKSDIGVGEKLEVDKIPPEQIAILYAKSAASLLLRGSSPELVQELEKTVKKALLVLKHSRVRPRVVAGGAAIFVEMALRIRKFALTFSGRQQLAVNAFADALETIPKALATNYGLDPIEITMQLRSAHSNNRKTIGVGELGCEDMVCSKVIELAAVNKTTIWRTFEVASLLMKIDDYFYIRDLPAVHKQ